jgi:hypothetical protein
MLTFWKIAVAAGLLLSVRQAAAGEPPDTILAPPRPDRLIVQSASRVSDGRKLQIEADGSFRRAEVGATGAGTEKVADPKRGGSRGDGEAGGKHGSAPAASADDQQR